MALKFNLERFKFNRKTTTQEASSIRLNSIIKKYQKINKENKDLKSHYALLGYTLYLKSLIANFPFQVVIFHSSSSKGDVIISYTRNINPTTSINFSLREFVLNVTFGTISVYKQNITKKVNKSLGLNGNCRIECLVDSGKYIEIMDLIVQKYG